MYEKKIRKKIEISNMSVGLFCDGCDILPLPKIAKKDCQFSLFSLLPSPFCSLLSFCPSFIMRNHRTGETRPHFHSYSPYSFSQILLLLPSPFFLLPSPSALPDFFSS